MSNTFCIFSSPVKKIPKSLEITSGIGSFEGGEKKE
jgi:hypothetical protein